MEINNLSVFISREAKTHSNRLERLKHQKEEEEKRKRYLEGFIEEIFSDAILYRVKDVLPEIRAASAQCLCNLAEKCPDMFMNSKGVSSLSFMLFDKSSDIRELILKLLNRVLSSDQDKWLLFVQEHKDRLLEMCYDIESKCSVLAIKNATYLARLNIFSQEDIEKVICLLWAELPDIRKEARDFIVKVMFSGKISETPPEDVIFKLIQLYDLYGEKKIYRVEIIVRSFWTKSTALHNLSLIHI